MFFARVAQFALIATLIFPIVSLKFLALKSDAFTFVNLSIFPISSSILASFKTAFVTATLFLVVFAMAVLIVGMLLMSLMAADSLFASLNFLKMLSFIAGVTSTPAS